VQQGAPAVLNVTSNLNVANKASIAANSTDPEDEGLESGDSKKGDVKNATVVNA
jgi:hypothetical protein